MGKREANSIFGSVTLIVILFIQVSFVIAAEFGSFEKRDEIFLFSFN